MSDPRYSSHIIRLPENAPGRYYVDSRCVDCDVCRDIAPDNFAREAGRKYSFVYKQPENAEEESLCQEALEACPVEAIGIVEW
ncbi:MAG: ferredoxin [Blastocatellia bacterium]|nr:ferredoxin [Blastocatellia bacterium]